VVYVKKITVENYSDFLEMATNQKFTFSQGIVETILDNINTRKKQIPVFEIEVDSEGATYTLSVERDEFIKILKTNLIHFENEEAYEGCQKIIEAINYLKTKNA
jgi:hypothetical protein